MWQDEAEENFKGVLSFDPEHVDAMTYLYWLTGMQERYEECAEWTRRRLLVEKGDYVPTLLAQRAFADPDTAKQEQALTDLAKLDDGTVWATLLAVTQYDGNFGAAAKICRIATDPSRAEWLRAEAHVHLARMAVARGRWSDVGEHIAAAESIDRMWATRGLAVLSITPPVELARETLETCLAEISSLEAHGLGQRAEQLYLAGIFSARLGGQSAAMGYAAQLDSLMSAANDEQAPGRSAWIGDLALGVRAEVYRLRENHAEALALLEQTQPGGLWKLFVPGLVDCIAYERYQRAMLLEKEGRLDEALRWYDSLGQVSTDGYIYLAPKHLKMGEVCERMGDGRKALEHYVRFVELWQDCDPEYRPLVEDVTARITRLNQ